MEAWFKDDLTTLYHGDSLAVLRTLPSESVQCVVTSPPYWALRDYGVEGQLGLEPTPEIYVEKMVEVFREVRRVLRNDGTLWLNIGDSYATKPCSDGSDFNDGRSNRGKRKSGGIPNGLKPKDLVGIPWMLAFALRSDGWYLRQDIVWAKKSPMPESVKDRCTKAHEYIFLLTKSQRYFYDAVGSQEETTGNAHYRGVGNNPKCKSAGFNTRQNDSFSTSVNLIVSSRNMRSVWPLASFPLKSAHFAAYPPELVRRCLSAAVSEAGCCSECGAPWERVTKKTRVATRPGTASKVPQNWATGNGDHSTLEHNTNGNHPKTKHDRSAEQNGFYPTEFGNRDPQRHVTQTVTTGWQQGCQCEQADQKPCVVLDLFHGAGTTMKVCQRLGVEYWGIELNEEYLQLSLQRPAVHFPHERRRNKRRATNSLSNDEKDTQLVLEFGE
jgi:DNA modification methylase